jgi:hypothetical protein
VRALLGWGIGLILIGGAAALGFRRIAFVADALFRLLVVLGCFGSLVKPPVRRTTGWFATSAEDRVLSSLVVPFWSRMQAAAAALRPLQQGRVRTYLQYIVFTLILLLCVLFASVGRRS